jgi:hypothetical protein
MLTLCVSCLESLTEYEVGDDSVVSLTLLCYWFDIIETGENHYAIERRDLHHLTQHQL